MHSAVAHPRFVDRLSVRVVATEWLFCDNAATYFPGTYCFCHARGRVWCVLMRSMVRSAVLLRAAAEHIAAALHAGGGSFCLRQSCISFCCGPGASRGLVMPPAGLVDSRPRTLTLARSAKAQPRPRGEGRGRLCEWMQSRPRAGISSPHRAERDGDPW